ncbi:midasin-like isoform X3 [Primulina eburnea]|uniref:midasin-like isoform X3 n=1 Tax=Primulina eburnea TaxID=1245227 RepID=UPI003C6C4ED2
MVSMAVDGRFCLQSEFRRFLDRRPKLKSLSRFNDLLNKGDLVTEDEVVDAVGQLLLHPKYTIPLLGCLRPIAERIVESTTKLVHSARKLMPDDDLMEEFDEEEFLRDSENVDGAEVANIIYIYVSRRKGLRLHELACLAFYRALDLIPFLLGSILKYFEDAPAPFERFVHCETFSKTDAKGANRLLNVVRASYGLLMMKTDIFMSFWDWSCYLDLLQKYPDSVSLDNVSDMRFNDELRDIVSDIRWCSIEILSLVLGLSFEASANLGRDSKQSIHSLLRWQEFCMEVSLEKGSWYLESPIQETSALVGQMVDLEEGYYLRSCRLNCSHKLSTVAHGIVPTRYPGNSFFLRSNMRKSFELVSLAVSQRWPVLLYGPSGSGKSTFINKLANTHGSRVLQLHTDEQMDGKTLIGSYVCTEQPGEFRWQPGSLTQAVLNGFWVVFEDIDKAPPDIISILLPLLEGSNLFSTGHGEVVRVNENFRLFSTITSSNQDIFRVIEGKNLLGAVWRKVMIGSPNDDDILNIVLEWFPERDSLAKKVIESFKRIVQLMRFQLGLTASSSYHDRFTLRDLLKLCERMASFGFLFDQDSLSTNACNSIYKEAVDVFASFDTSVGNRLAIMREIAKFWNVSTAESLYPINKPIIQESSSGLQVGRVSLEYTKIAWSILQFKDDKKPFVQLRSSVHVLEKIACSVKFKEPVLLVGETGTGKTTIVQTLASRIGQKLTVLNLSQQSDVADLLGGFKPVDARVVCIPLYQEFENLFTNSFSSKDNDAFLSSLRNNLFLRKWKHLLSGFQKAIKKVVEIVKSSPGKKRKRPLGAELQKAWENFSVKLENALAQVNASDGIVFSFVEGAFIKALRNGEWILLDEVNLAPPEILQRVIGVLEDAKGSVCLSERGDIHYVCRHPNFRIFACMNPATDAGKRDLPLSIRGRFTEYFVDDVFLNDKLDNEDLVLNDELVNEDLFLFINQFMDDDPSNRELISKIVKFYKAAKKTEERLQDGANQKPHYSLRSLYRALQYLTKAKRSFGFERSIYDGFSMFFLDLLDDSGAKLMKGLICQSLLGGKLPPRIPFGSYLTVKKETVDGYVLTKSVEQKLKNLARAIFIKRYPVLLQGPTSSGKTSLVWFLAEITGNKFVRINNHEHTDLQEYLGSYITDASGKLIFQEGALVKAVREGQWIVLDELNLAPSDVLEALNRLLDDNRELFVPELSETIRAHPDFMLFATQNPPFVYGGRKLLSRAFRNRFVEIHVDEIPQEELSTILGKKCLIPESYAKKMVDVMKELQLHRQSSKVFAGKHGFITPRDLFRWANRFRKYGSSYEDLAHDGYYLLAERLRDDAEKTIVKEVLEQQLQVKLFEDDLYKPESEDGSCTMMSDEYSENSENVRKISLTKSMRRTYFLIERCYKMREPVLLVGETGGGKTTVCQLLSAMLGLKLHILNCHQYTETSDFLGGFYPVRTRSKIAVDFQKLCEQFTNSKAFIHYPGAPKIFVDINQASQTLVELDKIVKSYEELLVSHPEVMENEISRIKKIYQDLCELHQTWQTIFMWQDGPLVEAMKRGDLFLVDEISLADDSVLERLNSVLEPERKLSLAEKGGSDLENIIAHDNFFLLATMNPGGDYGKKELSPALRNRFTEIWVPSVSDVEELKSIALKRISNPERSWTINSMLNFWEWFNLLQTGRLLTVRDILSWVSFINVTKRSLPAESALIHGAFLVALDGLSLGTNISKSDAAQLRFECLHFLLNKLKDHMKFPNSPILDTLNDYGWVGSGSSTVLSQANDMECDNIFGIHPFYIEKGTDNVGGERFEFMAPTTRRNTLRLLRAMQINKPVLLEGSPGVGKTSLIVALGRSSGHAVVRINLSEQTDIMDLLGSDLPVESDDGIQFAWSDGILLQALKNGSWVLLDELNLAPQSVLEGLNAILDHRSEVFIPELGRAFKCPTSFRVFACQNPSCQGGGRKGLPKSFLNRFTKVYVDELVEEDYVSICHSLFPTIERSLLIKLVAFNERLHQETMVYNKFGQQGSPWEFNLRDVIRSCEIIEGASEKLKPDCFLSVVYLQRMRTATDQIEVLNLYEQIFGFRPFINPYPRIQLNPCSFVAGNISIERYRYRSSCLSSKDLKILPCLSHCLEGVAQCVKHQWLCIVVGPPSSGKTSLIRLLAELTGNVLNELNLSSATDVSDLLGCFEQHNASRHYFLAIAQVEKYMNEYCNLQLEFSSEGLIRRKDLIARWLAFLSNISNRPTASSATYIDNPRMRDSIPHLVEIVEDLKLDNDIQRLSVSCSNNDLDIILNMIRKLEEENKKGRHSKKFEWVTGLLIKAIENGEWIVLENANLCNPTVLDRINSLVEQSGSIILNECGIVEGKPVVLHPHPKFRMFLTVNPSYGEISRAMRNRGVEIYMMQPYWLVDEKSGKNLNEIEVRDAKRFIALSGIPVGKLVEMMAKAHIYAMHEGSHRNVSITHLELSRWVQLFQWLITNGNRPCWSIQVSWEHTYLSSFGEEKGKDVVSQAAAAYLSNSELYKFTTSEDCLLCLPGGWPTPLKLRDFFCHSEETCVRQNCMYLESMGSQIASFIHSRTLNRVSKGQTRVDCGSRIIHLLDATLLHELMFPKASDNSILVNRGTTSEVDLVLAEKKLIFAADWVMEQATQNDYHLYMQWFDWFGTRLQPFFSFFNRYSDLLKNGVEMRFIDLFPSVDQLKSCHILVINLIKCSSQLRLSLRQWSSEDCYDQKNVTKQTFEPVLASLRKMEEKVLHVLAESPSFDLLFEPFCDLLEHHKLFWNSIISSHIDCQQIYWRSLMKDVMKLHRICPAEARTCQIKMKELEGISSLHLNSRKSLLWTYGGHPILPPSAELYQKQCQLSSLCELVWPRKNEFLKLGGGVVDSASSDDNDINEVTLTVALSSNIELRLLAMQGVCMSSYIIGKADGNFDCILRLEEMYQVLLGRLNFEKHKLKVRAKTTKHESGPAHSSACCLLTSDALCRKSGFECWLETQPLVDETTLFLDLELLQHLTEIVGLDIEEQHSALSDMACDLESCLNFSLNYSSRPPTDFLPHQKIIWTLDAWASVDRVTEKISSFISEMWLKWHITLWETCPVLAEIPGYDTLIPYKLFRPLKSVLVSHILQKKESVREYLAHMLKLRVASHNIWHSSANVVKSHDMMLSAARSLFQQIIYAHKKSFEDSSFANIRSAFQSIHRSKDTKASIKNLVSLLGSSNHHVFTSLIDSLIEPLLNELYPEPLLNELYPLRPSDEQRIGYAWLRIGCLRYNLLICCDDLDPTVKYSIKYSEVTEMIASLELEIQVRKECMYLAGSTPLGEAIIYNRINLLEKLNSERRRLRRKMVFRPNPEKFKKLKHECDDILNFVATLVAWMKNVKSPRTQLIIDQLRNWQGTTSCFIDRLSNEYSAYLDVIEPVQAALYEMKLGLSFFVPPVLYKECNANGQQNMEQCLGAIYEFMRFPRGYASKIISVNAGGNPELSIHDSDLSMSIAGINMDLLKKITSSTCDSGCDTMDSSLRFNIAVYHNVLARIKISAADAHILGDAPFKVLQEIFDKVSRYWLNWMDQKHQIKAKEVQWFKFRARAFKIESITQIDVSKFSNLLAKDSFLEWQEMLSEELDGKIETMENDWNLVEESDLGDMVNMHNQLFGSMDLVKKFSSSQVSDSESMYPKKSVSDAERLSSFHGTYMLGMEMMQGLNGSFSSIFDAKIAPEHLLCLCLEHANKSGHSTKSTSAYNFYKDSNSPVLAKLVEPVSILKQRILFLLKEWDDHPALQKILEVIDMILALPLDTPLAKALSGLQFLLSRIRTARETVVKFPLSDQLEPIFTVISSWRKLEFESWPALLDEVESQIERSAAKLWFPLYSVFQRSHTGDINQYKLSTIGSMEDFFRTSRVGDFKKQLQLVLSLHGHIIRERRQMSDESPCQVENVKILYNTFGFCVQFLPRILEHIQTHRRNIEMELTAFLKKCRWDHIENHLAFENMKRTRQELKKIVQKFMDLLQQPLIPFLEQAPRAEINNQSIQGIGHLPDPYDIRRNLLDTVCNRAQCKAKDSLAWFSNWWGTVELSLQNIGGNMDDINCSVPSPSSCLSYWERKESWHTIGKIYTSLLHSDELWENKHKNLRKRRAFSDLLRLLDNCGLSKRRTFVKDEFRRSWLLQPSYDVQHLLLSESDISSGNSDFDLDLFQSSSSESIWNTANKYYFKSISSMQTLEQISQNFHKDFSLVQVQTSGSYVDHLLEIQQEQRSAAYLFAEKLKCLRQCMLRLSNLFSSSIHSAEDTINDFSFSKNQYPTFKCMRQQKQLFDGFCTMIYEAHLLLLTFENTHLSTCSTVKSGAEKIRLFIQKIRDDFQKSKDLLDRHLLGSNGNVAMNEIELQPYGVTKEMELLVKENFQLIKTFKNNLSALRDTEDGKVAVTNILIGHFEDLFKEAQRISKEFNSSLQERNLPNSGDRNPDHGDGNVTESNSGFHDPLESTYENVLGVFQRVASLKCDFALTEDLLKDMKKWKTLFEKDTELLQLDLINKSAVGVLNSYGDGRLRRLYDLLKVILAFGDKLLSDFLEIHNVVCMLAHVLANIFASLFAKGLGTTEDQENEIVKETTQDGKGTGMGEGSGLNDVSDQINDEDQLLGTSDKPNEERGAMFDIPNENEKGIEMEEEFDGDTFSVSEDSGNDGDEEDQDEQLESAMGEVGSNGEIVDAKLGDGDGDGDDDNHHANEKYENGPSVKVKTSNDEELRAGEDLDTVNEDAGDLDANISSEQKDENEKGCDGAEDMDIDKDDAFSDPSGINLDEQNQRTEEDVRMDELETTEPMEDGESSEDLNALDSKNDEEKSDVMNEYLENTDLEQSGKNSETAATEEKGLEKDTGMDIRMPENNAFHSAANLVHDNIATVQSLGQPKEDFELADIGDFAAADEMLSNFNETMNELAPASGLHNSSQFEVKVADSENGKKLSQEQPRTSLPRSESVIPKSLPNPCRSVGNALDGWKERVKVSLDLQDQIEYSDDFMDDIIDEYGYTAEYEGSAQALGPATADQINGDVAQNDANRDTGNNDVQDPSTDNKIDELTSEAGPNKISALPSVDDNKKQQNKSVLEKQLKESKEGDGVHGLDQTRVSNSVSVQRPMHEDFNQLTMFPISDDELGKAHCSEQSNEARDDAVTLWKKYDLLTTRLSQELFEQLRLVMEPTQASRLEGYYRTGKKVNMRKVIACVASGWIKDNIWLRRTKPSKRDYQVVIAVDDSRSMSEGNCGGFAIEALVTVCRAMSLLDVGKMAVASFGRQGNIKLLHNFDQSFTAEAGIKMISNLTFKQENKITEEPMADLLKYLKNMLDTAAMHARLPSGYNPLQQLVLIISDGRLNEKKKLKHYVRDILSKKRMVAFLLLDSPKLNESESIIDLKEFTYEGEEIKESKYLNSFPFPFYVVMKNIEALPRALADLLRQWFELIQYSNEQ